MEYEVVSRACLEGIVGLCAAEGWTSYVEDAEVTWKALTGPGVWTVVAKEAGEVLGFAQILSDGQIAAFLSLVLVKESERGKGIGKRLIEEAYRRCGAKRVDLLTDTAAEFYRGFRHHEIPGFRIYPETTNDRQVTTAKED